MSLWALWAPQPIALWLAYSRHLINTDWVCEWKREWIQLDLTFFSLLHSHSLLQSLPTSFCEHLKLYQIEPFFWSMGRSEVPRDWCFQEQFLANKGWRWRIITQISHLSTRVILRHDSPTFPRGAQQDWVSVIYNGSLIINAPICQFHFLSCHTSPLLYQYFLEIFS